MNYPPITLFVDYTETVGDVVGKEINCSYEDIDVIDEGRIVDGEYALTVVQFPGAIKIGDYFENDNARWVVLT